MAISTGVATVSGTLYNASTGSTEYISNVVLGTEKVSNGGFDSGASWGLQTGWTISGGTLNATDVALKQQVYQNVGITQATRYRLSFEVSNYAAGYLNFLIGASFGLPNIDFNANGSYSYNVTSLPNSINGYLYARPVISAPLNLSVDNVSLKPLTIGCNGVATVSGTLNKKKISGFVHAASDNFDSYPDGVYLDSLPEWINIRSGVAPDALRITKTAGDGEVRFIGNGSAAYFYTRRGAFNNDQFVQFTLTAFNVNLPAAIVRGSEATNVTCYMWRSEYSSAYLIRRVNGTETNLITNGSVWSAGDVIRFEVKGSTLYFYRNGVLDTSMNGGSYTDTSPIASGSPGIAGYDSHDSYTQIDDWSGGNFVSTVSGTLSEGVPATTLIGSSAGVASVTGVLTGLSNIREIIGSATGVASVAGSAIRKARLSGVIGSKRIVADHTSVRKYIDIPQSYIDEVKKMWLSYAGESHSAAVRVGLTNLETAESKYAVSVIESGTPEAYTTANLRANRATWGDLNNASGWIYSYGEEDWYKSQTAINRTKAGLDYYHNTGPALAAFGFGWCWDPNEQEAAMATYNAATQEYEDHCRTNGYLTKVFFTTGPVDATNASGIVGYYKYLAYQAIRTYASQNKDRILFDYADILCYDNDGSGPNTAEYDGHTFPVITAANKLPDQVGHISNVGALRLAKAMWWMLARMGGWQGESLQVSVTGTLTEKAITEGLSGLSTGVSSVSGTLRATGQIYTLSNGVALVAGTPNGRGLLQGAISTNSTVSGLLLGLGRLAVSVNAIASVVGRLSSSGVFAGHMGGVASVSGSLSATVNISASINATANVAGALKGNIIAASSGVSTVTGRILATANLVATSNGVSTCSATPILETQVGKTDGITLVSGTLIAKGSLSSQIIIDPIVLANLMGLVNISGISGGVSINYALLNGLYNISGLTSGNSVTHAELFSRSGLFGSIHGINTSTAILGGHGRLHSNISQGALSWADLAGTGFLSGSSLCSNIVSGSIREYVPPEELYGSIYSGSIVSGSIWNAGSVLRIFKGNVSIDGVKVSIADD